MIIFDLFTIAALVSGVFLIIHSIVSDDYLEMSHRIFCICCGFGALWLGIYMYLHP